MKTKILSALIGLVCFIQPLFAQDAATNAAPVIPEAARKHFVMGTALFKDAKTAEDYAQVTGEFQQAAELAPQWPEARYNLALSKEAAGDYSGAMADLKLYQAFKLSESEARTVQDKIYGVEAKLAKANSPEGQRQALEKKATETGCIQAQATYADLINTLDGSVFTAANNSKLQFVKKPSLATGDSGSEYPQTSFLWCQLIGNDGTIFMPGFVIPTGKYTFKGNLYWWYGNFALSQDGQTMKETGKKSAFGHPEDDVVWHRDK